MKMVTSRKGLLLANLIFVMQAQSADWTSHQDFLRDHYDLSQVRKYWDDASWHIRCIFVDIDGDGRDELISSSTSEEEDRQGYIWQIWDIDASKRLRRIRWSGPIWYLCHPESFYKLVYRDHSTVVVGLDLYAGYMDRENRRIRRRTPDCLFSVPDGERHVLHEIKPSLDRVFRGPEIVSVERLYPEWYVGFDFQPPRDACHNPYGTRLPYKKPKGDLRPGGGVGEPNGFSAFVSEYRNTVRRRAGNVSKPITVYSVFLDANNDGRTDCYVTSDADRISDGIFKWTLFLGSEAGLAEAKEKVFPVAEKHAMCTLEPVVKAGKRSFCRVVRYDVPPTFVVLDEASSGKSLVRDAITPYSAHRIEKLPCFEYQDS